MSADEMINKAFGISAFTAVGHLLHINLKDNLLQHKHEIGKALLAKNSRALAVVNKINTIDNTYRNFEIEVIAKRDNCQLSDEELMICEVNENKCRYKFDFSKVYWNSRLCTEHERLIAKLNKPCDIVIDLFAGVGPFVVPAAKSKNKVFANDLNPDAVKWLDINMKRNKVLPSNYEIFNMDSKEFIMEQLGKILSDEYKRVDVEELATMPTIHIIMNLPALAPTFLPYFMGILNLKTSSNLEQQQLKQTFRRQNLRHVLYCYCFLKGAFDDPKPHVRDLIEQNFGRRLNDDQLVDIFRVRNVAPFKEMYRVEIKLDEEILFATKDLVSIMKHAHGQTMSNGCPAKKVSINDSKRKRPPEDSTEKKELDEGVKKARVVSNYCSLM